MSFVRVAQMAIEERNEKASLASAVLLCVLMAAVVRIALSCYVCHGGAMPQNLWSKTNRSYIVFVRYLDHMMKAF